MPGRLAARLQRHGGIHRPGGIALQHFGHTAQAFLLRVVPPEEETRVGGMIIAAVEIPESLVGQVRDHFGIAAGIQAVERIREDGLLALFRQHGIRRGIGPLHLIIDDPLVRPLAVGRLGLDVPALLPEDVLADAGMEDRIHIDVHQVVEILKVGAGHGIAGLVREGESIEEGLERALEQLHERLLDRVFVRTAEHGMLQDMGDPRGVRRGRAETHAEAFVFVVVADGKQLRTGHSVPPEACRPVDFLHGAFGKELKAVCLHVSSCGAVRGFSSGGGAARCQVQAVYGLCRALQRPPPAHFLDR